ncbi:MAG: serine--tRNA ligase [Candidatus Omnitrophota bacterium]|nr:MAG: serine--tRNA ligase [Candidatus Omnitrophota bacterium]RKY42065.1 MAG: serine--tRNA ligase [Candidatus Omnitrophota bacterium]
MLDIKFIRENPQIVCQALEDRGLDFDLDGFLKLDEKRRSFIKEIDSLRTELNKINDEISSLLKEKKDPKPKIEQTREISKKLDGLEEEFKKVKEQFTQQLLNIPNIPHPSIPKGSPANNKVVRTWGEPKTFSFKPLTHIELAENLGIIDFKRASKITGSNFILFKGQGALLERALFNFMLDLHTQKHGYKEVFPPFLVNRASMTGTGQLPKLEEDMYRLKDDDLFLIPTAEVPVTNIFRDEVLEEEQLPVYYTAYTACFRREAGSYGKETKGLVRVHQFDKVELVKFVKPGNSYEELEKLVRDAEEVLQLLKLPYRVVMLATQDLSFSASKCYDLEVYSPGIDKWLEVSSCSNFEDFQARRANIRYKDKATGRKLFLHTLNGSGIALARTVVAILENYQQEDGCIVIPEVLRKYMHARETIQPE